MARPIGPWTDLYSVGVIAFELLLGRVPFEDLEYPLAVLYRHIHDPVPPPLSIRPDLGPGIARWIERLLPRSRASVTSARWTPGRTSRSPSSRSSGRDGVGALE
jgi:serine/threonine protein kinase